LDETLKEFMQTVNQPFHEITYATLANTEEIERLEGQLGHLVAEFNIIKEEEFQSQEMEVQMEKWKTTEISSPDSSH
jgi:hypothetical protein